MAMAMASIALKRASPRTSTRTKASGTASVVEQALQDRTYVLLDAPVSNHGARVRFVVYAKGVERDVQLLSPSALGGMRTPEYLKHNPFGKMPLLLTRIPIRRSSKATPSPGGMYIETTEKTWEDVHSTSKNSTGAWTHSNKWPSPRPSWRERGELGRRHVVAHFVFFEYILTAKFGWNDLFQSRPKLKVWWEAMHQLPAGNKVQEKCAVPAAVGR
eukprot:jgi/Pico_ML_1/52760/g3423.t1